jgi:ABC-type multidrug transport system ATPase subunit
MISVQQIHKKFGKLEVLKDFNLEFESGKSYALMGPNGSGKTTLIKIILGMSSQMREISSSKADPSKEAIPIAPISAICLRSEGILTISKSVSYSR